MSSHPDFTACVSIKIYAILSFPTSLPNLTSSPPTSPTLYNCFVSCILPQMTTTYASSSSAPGPAPSYHAYYALVSLPAYARSPRGADSNPSTRRSPNPVDVVTSDAAAATATASTTALLAELVRVAKEVAEVAALLEARSEQCARIANKSREISFALAGLRSADIMDTMAKDMRMACR
jgi:hypothetical protein